MAFAQTSTFDCNYCLHNALHCEDIDLSTPNSKFTKSSCLDTPSAAQLATHLQRSPFQSSANDHISLNTLNERSLVLPSFDTILESGDPFFQSRAEPGRNSQEHPPVRNVAFQAGFANRNPLDHANDPSQEPVLSFSDIFEPSNVDDETTSRKRTSMIPTLDTQLARIGSTHDFGDNNSARLAQSDNEPAGLNKEFGADTIRLPHPREIRIRRPTVPLNIRKLSGAERVSPVSAHVDGSSRCNTAKERGVAIVPRRALVPDKCSRVEPAVTFTAIHLFSQGSGNNQAVSFSGPSAGQKRVGSTLQVVRSRDSVYEIIWEDNLHIDRVSYEHEVGPTYLDSDTLPMARQVSVEHIQTSLASWSWGTDVDYGTEGMNVRNTSAYRSVPRCSLPAPAWYKPQVESEELEVNDSKSLIRKKDISHHNRGRATSAPLKVPVSGLPRPHALTSSSRNWSNLPLKDNHFKSHRDSIQLVRKRLIDQLNLEPLNQASQRLRSNVERGLRSTSRQSLMTR